MEPLLSRKVRLFHLGKIGIQTFFFVVGTMFIAVSGSWSKTRPMSPGPYKAFRIVVDVVAASNLDKLPKGASGVVQGAKVALYALFPKEGGKAVFQRGVMVITDYHRIGSCSNVTIPPGTIGRRFERIHFDTLTYDKGGTFCLGGAVHCPKWDLPIVVNCPPYHAKEIDQPLSKIFEIFNNYTNPMASPRVFSFNCHFGDHATFDNLHCFHDLLISKVTIIMEDLGLMESPEAFLKWIVESRSDEGILTITKK